MGKLLQVLAIIAITYVAVVSLGLVIALTVSVFKERGGYDYDEKTDVEKILDLCRRIFRIHRGIDRRHRDRGKVDHDCRSDRGHVVGGHLCGS